MIADSSSRNQRHNEAPPFLGDIYASEAMNIAEGVRRGGAREEIGGLTWLWNSGEFKRRGAEAKVSQEEWSWLAGVGGVLYATSDRCRGMAG